MKISEKLEKEPSCMCALPLIFLTILQPNNPQKFIRIIHSFLHLYKGISTHLIILIKIMFYAIILYEKSFIHKNFESKDFSFVFTPFHANLDVILQGKKGYIISLFICLESHRPLNIVVEAFRTCRH